MSDGFGIEVHYVDGRTESHDFGSEKVTIGSADDAQLSIKGVIELAPYHVLMVAADKGCWVSTARDVTVPVTCNGVKVENAVVPFGTELDIGPVSLHVVEPAETRRAKEARKRTLLRVSALAMAAIGASFVLQTHKQQVPQQPTKAPELFNSTSIDCDLQGQRAFERATELSATGDAYMQRYAFDAQDGIRAASAYEQARACYRAAGDVERARAAASERDRIVNRLNDDYRTLRIRLLRSLQTRSFGDAKKFVSSLSNMLQHRPGPYTDWLLQLWHYLEAQEHKS